MRTGPSRPAPPPRREIPHERSCPALPRARPHGPTDARLGSRRDRVPRRNATGRAAGGPGCRASPGARIDRLRSGRSGRGAARRRRADGRRAAATPTGHRSPHAPCRGAAQRPIQRRIAGSPAARRRDGAPRAVAGRSGVGTSTTGGGRRGSARRGAGTAAAGGHAKRPAGSNRRRRSRGRHTERVGHRRRARHDGRPARARRPRRHSSADRTLAHSGTRAAVIAEWRTRGEMSHYSTHTMR